MNRSGRERAKAFLYAMPAPLQRPLRWGFDWLRYPPGSSMRQRISFTSREYTPFGRNQRYEIMLDIARFATINRPIAGYYMEFGSHEANTMRMAWRVFGSMFDWDFIAFDSFQGLPDIAPIDEQEIWGKGRLATAEQEFINQCRTAGMPKSRLQTVKGFYDDSLTPELQQELLPKRAAVVYVDCDLYKSTVPVLEFIKPFLQPGTILVFDDWNCFFGDPERGERRAWREFLNANPDLRFEPFVQTGMQASFVHLGPPSSMKEAEE